MPMDPIDWNEVRQFLGWVWKACHAYNASVTSGCRTELRNEEVSPGVPSKHTFRHGWGMACDLWFDKPKDRDRFITFHEKHPRYHIYVGPDYDPHQLHVQGWKYQERPHRRSPMPDPELGLLQRLAFHALRIFG